MFTAYGTDHRRLRKLATDRGRVLRRAPRPDHEMIKHRDLLFTASMACETLRSAPRCYGSV